MSAKSRLLPPAHIPTTLWDRSSETLTLPSALASAYERLIHRLGLHATATTRVKGVGAVGGLSKESADQHLAQAFDGSAARVMLAALDPRTELGPTSDSFIQSTAGASLALTDAPCGAAAAALAFLTVLAELRAKRVLPRLPLDVKFVGGELSPHAIAHAQQLFGELLGELEARAIFVDCQFHVWNVLESLSTADLVKASLLHGSSCTFKLLVIANFNGFLVKDKKQSDAQPQLDELLRYASGEQSLALWIEPEMNRSTGSGGLFSWLLGLLQSKWRLFARSVPGATEDAPGFCSEARFRLPLAPAETSRVKLAVMSIDLTRAGSR